MGLLQSIVARLFPGRKRSSTSSRDDRAELGRKGEREAARALRRAGYKILYRNFRAPGGGEVDLVARHGETLVFIEVKSRRSEQYGAPAEAVTPAKQALIVKGAVAWLKLLRKPGILVRFDVAEVRFDGRGKAVVNVIENAFSPPEDLHIGSYR